MIFLKVYFYLVYYTLSLYANCFRATSVASYMERAKSSVRVEINPSDVEKLVLNPVSLYSLLCCPPTQPEF